MSTPNLAIVHIVASQTQKEVTANAAFDELDTSMTGQQTINCAGGSNVTVTNPTTPGAPLYNFDLLLTGALTGNIELILPAAKKAYAITNNTTGTNPSLSLPWVVTVITSAGGSTGVSVPQGQSELVYSDGTNVISVAGAGGVTSFNSRTGAVVPQSGDYSTSELSDWSDAGVDTGDVPVWNASLGMWISSDLTVGIMPIRSAQKFQMQGRVPRSQSLAGNSFSGVIPLTNYDWEVWEFLPGVDGSVYFQIRVPDNVAASPNAKIVVSWAANNTTASKQVAWIVSDGKYAAGSAADISFSAETQQNIAVPTTAYQRVDTLFPASGNIATSLSAGDFLVIELKRKGSDGANDTLTTLNALVDSVYLVVDVQ